VYIPTLHKLISFFQRSGSIGNKFGYRELFSSSRTEALSVQGAADSAIPDLSVPLYLLLKLELYLSVGRF